MPSDRQVEQHVVWLVAVLATLMAQLTLLPGSDWTVAAFQAAMIGGTVWVLGSLAASRWQTRPEPRWLNGWWLAAFLFQIVLQGDLSQAWQDPIVLRGFCVAALRNVTLAAALLACWNASTRVAMLASLVLAVLAISIRPGTPSVLALIVYLPAVTYWMMLQHWRELARHPLAGNSRQMPLRSLAAVSAVVLLAVVVGLLFYPASATALAEFLSQWIETPRGQVGRDPRRRIEANQQTVAALADQKYGAAKEADDDQGNGKGNPNADLYDAGKLALRSWADLNARTAKNFSVLRRSPEQIARQGGKTLFELGGNLLQHVPVVAYDQFNGQVWSAEPPRVSPHVVLEVQAEDLWVAMLDPLAMSIAPDGGVLDQYLQHGRPQTDSGDAVERARASLAQLLAKLQGSGRPLTPQLDAAAELNRLRDWLATPPGDTSLGGVLDPRYLLTPYDLQDPDLRKIFEELHRNPRLLALLAGRFSSPGQKKSLADRLQTWLLERIARQRQGLPDAVRRLVQQWTAGKPPGWPQIDAVVQGVRRQAVHDPSATLPPGTPDPVGEFLLDKRRGPDYLFATSTATILRSLGYPTRLTGGFYADPARRNWFTGRIPVHSGDLHYWPQTRLENGLWVDLEPTPGYSLPASPFRQQAWYRRLARQTLDWLSAHELAVIGGGLALAAALAARRTLADGLATGWWRIRARGRLATCVLASWRLIEGRARSVGCGRPPGATLGQWYPRQFPAASPLRPRLQRLAELANRTAYAPRGLESAGDEAAIRALCRATVRDCTRAALRPRLEKQTTSPPAV